MDSNGFYHNLTCTFCGVPLQGQDSDYPAESYAGTWNGLCHACTSKPVYVVSTSPLDGAQTLSYAPYTPAWRRDRTICFAYPDCDTCGGKGRKIISRSMGQGGPYPEHCRVCSTRYWSHPHREWINRLRHQIETAAEHVYQQQLLNAGLLTMVGKGKQRHLELVAGADPQAIEAIRTKVLERHARSRTRLNRLRELVVYS